MFFEWRSNHRPMHCILWWHQTILIDNLNHDCKNISKHDSNKMDLNPDYRMLFIFTYFLPNLPSRFLLFGQVCSQLGDLETSLASYLLNFSSYQIGHISYNVWICTIKCNWKLTFWLFIWFIGQHDYSYSKS